MSLQIEWEGRDRFTVTVTEPPALAAARQEAAAARAAAEALAAQAEAEQPVQLKGRPVRKQLRWDAVDGGGSDGEVDVRQDEGDSEDISVLLQQQQAQQQQGSGEGLEDPLQLKSLSEAVAAEDAAAAADSALTDQIEGVAADSAALAEQIESVREDMQAGRKPSAEALSEIGEGAGGRAGVWQEGWGEGLGAPAGVRLWMCRELRGGREL